MKKILLVDDETDLQKVFLYRLRKMGYEAFGAVNGFEALEQARKEMPDAIVMDVYLPGMRGDEATRKLKGDENLKHIPVLLISADAVHLEANARWSGADAYLSKPFESRELIEKVERLSSPCSITPGRSPGKELP